MYTRYTCLAQAATGAEMTPATVSYDSRTPSHIAIASDREWAPIFS